MLGLSRTKLFIAAAAALLVGAAGLTASTAMASSARTGHFSAKPQVTISSPSVPETAGPPLAVLEAAGLGVGTNEQGDLYGEGPAPVVELASGTLHALGVNEIVGYSGKNETGTGAVIITGDAGNGGTACVDGPPTLPEVWNVDDLTPEPVQVRDGSCADPGKADGAKIAAGSDANLPAVADIMFF